MIKPGPHTQEEGVKFGCPHCVWASENPIKTPEECYCGLATEHTGEHAEVLKPIRTNVETKYLIWSNEYNGWLRPEKAGYSNYKELAGRYTLEEATEICNEANKYIDWVNFLPHEKIPMPHEVIVPDNE